MAAALSSTLSKPVSRIRSSSPITPPPPSPLLVLLESSTVEKEKIGLGPTNGNTIEGNLSPFLQEMVDEQRILQMNVGKAMDTLRSDYPYFLKRAPGK